MAELKPKQDPEMAPGKPKAAPVPSPETKPHGDKFQGAMDKVLDDKAKANQKKGE